MTYKYDYYHIISGQDLMTVNCEVFDSFFEQNKGYEFIEFKDDYLNNPECVRRTKYYHFLQEYRRHFNKQILNSFFTFLERISLAFQIVIHIDRTKSLDWSIRVGSNWVSITDDLVSDVLNNKDKIKKVFSNTNCSDELFISTVAYNYGYYNRIYRWNGKTTNMRWVDFSRGGNGNPYIIHKEDIDSIANTHNLFARKFSEAVDEDAIDNMIEQAKYAKSISD